MTSPKSAIDERTVEQARNADVADVIGRFVKLRKAGNEYEACCPFHDESTPSFKVNPRKNFYFCFGCGATGNAIDFIMDYEGLSFPEAVERIVGKLPDTTNAVSTGKITPKPSVWRGIRTASDNAPEPSFNHWRLGDPSHKWAYHDTNGRLIGYVCRFPVQKPDGSTGKETLPLCWAVNTDTGDHQWRWLSFPVPRPLYGLDLLASRPDHAVLVAEGEKATDAARQIFPSFVGVSWPGGGKAVGHTDFTALAGRKVTLWPDWDWKHYPDNHPQAGQLMPLHEQPGVVAMRGVFDAIKDIAAEVRIVPPMVGSPDGWDLADAAPCDGFSAVSYAKANVRPAAGWFAEIEPAQAEAEPKPAANDNKPSRQKPEKQEPTFGRPLDIFGVDLPPQLPLEVLPAAMRDYVRDQSELLGCDHSVVGMAALVAAASCITDGIRLQPKRMDPTWTESARLWVAFVGDPSTKKTPAISKAVRHVKRIDHRLAESNASAYGDWKFQHEQWKEAKKADKTNPPPEPKQPPVERLIVEDITVEALSEVLKDNPRGVLCLQDELTGWFASMDAYKGAGKGASKDRAHWLEAYNGGRRAIDRVTRGNLIIPNWSVCMIGGIQQDMIRRVASSMGNDGLLQRFMVVVARSASTDVDRVPDMRAMEQYAQLFDKLVSIGPSETVVTMTEAAHRSRERVSDYARRLVTAFDHPHMRAWLGKWDGLFARLVLLYHIIDCASRSIYPTNEQIRGETAAMVERLMCGTLLHHAIHFYSEILDAHDRQENMRQLGRMILGRGLTAVSKRDITLYWKASRAMADWELQNVVTSLCNMDWLIPDMTLMDSNGKPRLWHVNPDVHTLFANYADREKQRRQEAVDTLRALREAYQPTPN